MGKKIGFTNDYQPKSLLREIAKDKRVAEIEGEGMDRGRVFVHLVPGYYIEGYGAHSFGTGVMLDHRPDLETREEIEQENRSEMEYMMSLIKRDKK